MLQALGWQQVRMRGDHMRLVREGGKNPVTVPMSPPELDPYVLSNVLRQAGLTTEEFQRVAEEVL